MYIHRKELLFPVQVDSPNPSYAAAVLEQFGGANGELKACLQYFVQSFSTRDEAIKDLLMDISTEEISHLEMVGTLITQLMGNPHEDKDKMSSQEQRMDNEAKTLATAETNINTLFQYNSAVQKSIVLAGHGPSFVDSAGAPFSGNFINSVGDLVANLHANLADEMKARKVYEELYRHINDRGAREALEFLLKREEAHSLLFMEAIERAKELGAMDQTFGKGEHAKFYADLSEGGNATETFPFAKDNTVVTGPVN